jgi:hypothetical protein
MCRQVGEWFHRRGVRDLEITPAETHPSGALTRITYEPGDGSRPAIGVEALARALEHVHLGWALVGCAIRLPGVRPFVQLVTDASGGQPRRIVSAPLQHQHHGVGADLRVGPGADTGVRPYDCVNPKQYSQPRVRR